MISIISFVVKTDIVFASSLPFVALQQKRRIVPAEAQRIGQSVTDLFVYRLPAVIQIALFIGHLIPHCSMKEAFLQLFDAGDKFHGSCSAKAWVGDRLVVQAELTFAVGKD